jgi:hypothetical protein
VLAIGDDASGDVVVDADGKERINWENVQRSRLRCDNRKWFCAKVAPKRYGERFAAEVSGPGGGPIETLIAGPPMTPAEVRKAVKALVSGAEADLGLPPGRGGLKARMKAILDSGEPLPPDVYAVTNRLSNKGFRQRRRLRRRIQASVSSYLVLPASTHGAPR